MLRKSKLYTRNMYVEGGYYLLIDYFSKREKEEKVFGMKIGK